MRRVLRGLGLLAIVVLALIILVEFLIILGVVVSKDAISIPMGERVVLVSIEGPLYESKMFIKTLEKYKNNRSVKAIVLRVNSPEVRKEL